MANTTGDNFRGSCLCGAVRYEVTSAPVHVAQCCCSDCQKLTGTGHATIAFYRDTDFSVSGPVTAFEKFADSGNCITRHFCPTCGSALFGRNTGRPRIVFVYAGTLDDDGAHRLGPAAIVFAARRAPWDLLDDRIPHFPAMPPPPKS